MKNVAICTLVAAGLLLGITAEARGKRGGKKTGSSYSRSHGGTAGAGYGGDKVEVMSMRKPRAGCLLILELDEDPKKPKRWTCPK